MLRDPGRDAVGEGSLQLQSVCNLFLQFAFVAFSLPCPKGPDAVSALRQTHRPHPLNLAAVSHRRGNTVENVH